MAGCNPRRLHPCSRYLVRSAWECTPYLKPKLFLNPNTAPLAGHFYLRVKRKATKRNGTLLLVFATQKSPPSGTILGLTETDQLGLGLSGITILLVWVF